MEPGDPNNSYLYRKVAGTHRVVGGTGNRMPPTSALSSAQIAMICTWITEGAPNN